MRISRRHCHTPRAKWVTPPSHDPDQGLHGRQAASLGERPEQLLDAVYAAAVTREGTQAGFMRPCRLQSVRRVYILGHSRRFPSAWGLTLRPHIPGYAASQRMGAAGMPCHPHAAMHPEDGRIIAGSRRMPAIHASFRCETDTHAKVQRPRSREEGIRADGYVCGSM